MLISVLTNKKVISKWKKKEEKNPTSTNMQFLPIPQLSTLLSILISNSILANENSQNPQSRPYPKAWT